ncbi:MAG: hypothetical protein J6S85_06165 [Methanobrevibacter sp.]|nr:hypothetical protein [Methanobrevibacter sp.]
MDVTQFVQLIANVGFPIACCIAMFILMQNNNKAHKEEMIKMTDALNNNTKAIEGLKDELRSKR